MVTGNKKTTNYVLVETVGIEPTSRDIATQASTSVVGILVIRSLFGLPTGFQGASLINLFYPSSDGGR